MGNTSVAEKTGPLLFNRERFVLEFAKEFSGTPKYNAGAVTGALDLITMIETDKEITDVRWAAYMLATTMWETTSPTWIERPVVNKKGLAVVGKDGQPVTVKQRKWLITMEPVSEIGAGKGRRYHEPVKIAKLADGNVRVTEHDGDQFLVKPTGAIVPINKSARMGATDGAKAAKTYHDDEGVEQVFFGRGYVQLTWWSNYVRAGVAIGRGFDLLTDPDLVKSPEIAFQILATGMKTGGIYANGHTLDKYISGRKCDYVHARRMVNGLDHADDIAALAKKLEKVLMNSRAYVESQTLQLAPLP